MSQLTVIVPFFNEEKYLRESVYRVVAEKIIDNIILVNDCSTDKSYKIAKELEKEFSNITLISTQKNLGKGNAVQEALKYVTTSHLIVHDADLEYFPEDIPEMFIKATENPNSLIIGSRTIGNKKRTNIYKKNYYGQKLLSKFFSILNFIKISDIASCYWLIETNKLKVLNIEQNGFAIEVEVISKSLKLGLSIIEVPIRYEARSYEQGKKIKVKDAFFILFKIIILSKSLSFFEKNQIG